MVRRAALTRKIVGSNPTFGANYSGIEKRSSRKVHCLEIVGSNPTSATNMGRYASG